MTIFYNDNDIFAIKWLNELIIAELIPKGKIDGRSISEIKPEEIQELTQCHFFAGIAGWPRALDLAGWNPNEPVWTASLPCQPLSVAGQQRGHEDERHLWPIFFDLVKECRPSVIFGEQVSSKDGREWLSGIQTDLETLGYICAAADLPAASVGSPHKRNRLFWVANAEDTNGRGVSEKHTGRRSEEIRRSGGTPGGLADSEHNGGRSNIKGRKAQERTPNFWSNSTAIPCADGKWRQVPAQWVDESEGIRSQGFSQCREGWNKPDESIGIGSQKHQLEIEPALFPLADGFSNRVGALRGAGNAIVPQVAAEFIRAVMQIL